MVEAELGRFGDKRLAGVGNALLASMRSERTLCLPQLAKDRNQACSSAALWPIRR